MHGTRSSLEEDNKETMTMRSVTAMLIEPVNSESDKSIEDTDRRREMDDEMVESGLQRRESYITRSDQSPGMMNTKDRASSDFSSRLCACCTAADITLSMKGGFTS